MKKILSLVFVISIMISACSPTEYKFKVGDTVRVKSLGLTTDFKITKLIDRYCYEAIDQRTGKYVNRLPQGTKLHLVKN